MGKSKKYKKGFIDAANLIEEHRVKDEKAIRAIADKLEKQEITIKQALEDLKGDVIGIFDYLSTKEKQELYALGEADSVLNLEPAEAKVLLAMLMGITNAENERQQKYLSGLKRELEIKEIPSISVDPSEEVENIDSRKDLKVMLRTIMEYLALQEGEYYDETDEQRTLLNTFVEYVKEKDVIYISAYIDFYVKCFGIDGLAGRFDGKDIIEVEEETPHQEDAIEEKSIVKKNDSVTETISDKYGDDVWNELLLARKRAVFEEYKELMFTCKEANYTVLNSFFSNTNCLQINNALNVFGYQAEPKLRNDNYKCNIIGLLDTTFRSNGKRGILFTTNEIVYREGKERLNMHPCEYGISIHYDEIIEVEIIKTSKCDMFNNLIIHTNNSNYTIHGNGLTKTPFKDYLLKMRDLCITHVGER